MPLSQAEQWVAIPGIESYEVSDAGRVRRARPARASRPGKLLKLKIDDRGYNQVTLSHEGRRWTGKVHSLVALAFIGPRRPGLQVNHISGDKRDNSTANLEYVTAEENVRHAQRNGFYRRGQLARWEKRRKGLS